MWDQDILFQSGLASIYATVGGMNLASGKDRIELLGHEIIFLTLISILYKLLWFKMLFRIYNTNKKIQDRKTRFLPLVTRHWHGKIVNIGEEDALLSKWNNMWTEKIQ